MLSNLRLPRFHYVSLDGEKSHSGNRNFERFAPALQYWKEAVIICLCIVCALLTSQLVFNAPDARDRAKVPDYRETRLLLKGKALELIGTDLMPEDTRWRQFQWNTIIYSSANPNDDEVVNAAWEQIVPAYGIVAVDQDWAVHHHLPSSMHLPSDSSKSVYIIDAYHQLHCLTIIRKTLLELASGQTLSKPMQHSRHCFDSLLQYIVCGNSGDTLLYTWGRNETGDGQLRRCVDWNERKKWAKTHSACYRDSERPIALYDHFDHCGDGDDGVRIPGIA